MFRRHRPGTLVIVGLGNPGPGYARTRHNAGSDLVGGLADRLGVSLARGRSQMRTANSELGGREVILAVPTTYMNESGRPVVRLVRKTGIRPADLVVCHDELDLPPGRVRLKAGGGTAGHNGLRSIEAALRSRDFLRLRIGVGKPPSKHEGSGHVLSRMPPEDRALVDGAIERGIEALEVLAAEDLEAAQNFLHSSG